MANRYSYTKRKETKYFVSRTQYTILSSLLKSVMDVDKNSNDNGEYFVRSLYFDTLNRKDLMEKEAGINHRRKIRFRYYSENPDFLKLETKEKINRYTIKKSDFITKEEAIKILDLDFNPIKDDNLKLYNHLLMFSYRPVVIIDYEREAYVSDNFNLRINFDKNIRGSSNCLDPFNEDLLMVPLIEPELYILEVKHDGHLPEYIQQILATVDLTPVSYSKYYYGGLL